MRLEEVKRGLWGYQRDAVFRYIAGQEEAFGQKLAEKDAQMMRAGQQAQAGEAAADAGSVQRMPELVQDCDESIYEKQKQLAAQKKPDPEQNKERMHVHREPLFFSRPIARFFAAL